MPLGPTAFRAEVDDLTQVGVVERRQMVGTS
jgi:hypothetical protein